MSFGILTPDRLKTNLAVFLILAVICGGLYFNSAKGRGGCAKYPHMLASCAEFECTQNVHGFRNNYGGLASRDISRQITGIIHDPYFDETSCGVVENNGDGAWFCRYSREAVAQAVERDSLLFGVKDNEAIEQAKGQREKNAIRAAFATGSMPKGCEGMD